jgi:AcrR family transcriptional regulator
MGVQERKEREKELRRESIVDAAEKILFSRGYENMSMDKVSREAELGKGTIYLYFKSKNELFHAVVARGLQILLDSFVKATEKPGTGMEKIMAIGRAYYDFFLNQRNYFDSLIHAEAEETEYLKTGDCPNMARCEELGNQIFGS